MYNRYRGNGSKPERVEEHVPAKKAPVPTKKPLPTKNTVPKTGLQNLLPKSLGQNLSELETEDLLLILILYLMYRESGDQELLLIIGAMYLL